MIYSLVIISSSTYDTEIPNQKIKGVNHVLTLFLKVNEWFNFTRDWVEWWLIFVLRIKLPTTTGNLEWLLPTYFVRKRLDAPVKNSILHWTRRQFYLKELCQLVTILLCLWDIEKIVNLLNLSPFHVIPNAWFQLCLIYDKISYTWLNALSIMYFTWNLKFLIWFFACTSR